jgi:hypothetical protein
MAERVLVSVQIILTQKDSCFADIRPIICDQYRESKLLFGLLSRVVLDFIGRPIKSAISVWPTFSAPTHCHWTRIHLGTEEIEFNYGTIETRLGINQKPQKERNGSYLPNGRHSTRGQSVWICEFFLTLLYSLFFQLISFLITLTP